jgi:hypothetical protein
LNEAYLFESGFRKRKNRPTQLLGDLPHFPLGMRLLHLGTFLVGEEKEGGSEMGEI